MEAGNRDDEALHAHALAFAMLNQVYRPNVRCE
jgi:hypothetical protein